MVCPAVGFFQLQVFEEAFADSVVEGVSLFGKGSYYNRYVTTKGT